MTFRIILLSRSTAVHWKEDKFKTPTESRTNPAMLKPNALQMSETRGLMAVHCSVHSTMLALQIPKSLANKNTSTISIKLESHFFASLPASSSV
ncbi:hypothetical protein RvY_16222 [Ramazzottius varieornatus]|uniref:Uncharacterized protein n=1 Tax=Ramazzottius varieornatus TaxID=947166 RepID=A0A1D1VZ18_RAMVA|nr:hypothetical protein RvY_16222 [Ramazzottius varieornatus]